jgi:hypothetical protein
VEGDCRGLSIGETVAELAVDEAEESSVMVRLMAATRGGTAVEVMVGVVVVWRARTCERGCC